VKEYIFDISDDPVQDYDSVHKMQRFIQNYLTKDLGYNTQRMHEFTDRSAAQYKSRHCIGYLSCSLADFGLPIQRNYYETSHAKGGQDAAGSRVKQKVSQAILRRTATITSASPALFPASTIKPLSRNKVSSATAKDLSLCAIFWGEIFC